VHVNGMAFAAALAPRRDGDGHTAQSSGVLTVVLTLTYCRRKSSGSDLSSKRFNARWMTF
jgi:hypothetical protein